MSSDIILCDVTCAWVVRAKVQFLSPKALQFVWSQLSSILGKQTGLTNFKLVEQFKLILGKDVMSNVYMI